MKIDRDDFEEWLANPITEALLLVCNIGEIDAQETWLEASFVGGRCDPVFLAEVRSRAAAFREIRELTAEKIEEIVNEHR